MSLNYADFLINFDLIKNSCINIIFRQLWLQQIYLYLHLLTMSNVNRE